MSNERARSMTVDCSCAKSNRVLRSVQLPRFREKVAPLVAKLADFGTAVWSCIYWTTHSKLGWCGGFYGWKQNGWNLSLKHFKFRSVSCRHMSNNELMSELVLFWGAICQRSPCSSLHVQVELAGTIVCCARPHHPFQIAGG